MVIREIQGVVAEHIFVALIDQIRNQVLNNTKRNDEILLDSSSLIDSQLNFDFGISGPRNFIKQYKDEIERLNSRIDDLEEELEIYKVQISNLERQIATNYDSPMLKPLEDYINWFSGETK